MFKTSLKKSDLAIDKMAIRLNSGQKAGLLTHRDVGSGVEHEAFRGHRERAAGPSPLGFSDAEAQMTRKRKRLSLAHVRVKSNAVNTNVIAHATRGKRKQEKSELSQQRYAVNWNPIREAMGKATAGEETQGGDDGMRHAKNKDQLEAAPLRVRDYVYRETDHAAATHTSLRT